MSAERFEALAKERIGEVVAPMHLRPTWLMVEHPPNAVKQPTRCLPVSLQDALEDLDALHLRGSRVRPFVLQRQIRVRHESCHGEIRGLQTRDPPCLLDLIRGKSLNVDAPSQVHALHVSVVIFWQVRTAFSKNVIVKLRDPFKL
eukprot:CAMPEP_0194543268 /NCGR_PEP_ID=MMETSP0253-20130528/85508_1 /TAXON_ID=2966 /ORGANISM="Noctiluca scintillans" /LENGTH=144 /DNA_ID=CAMNT_0039390009 /DNA_START=200 /DNA_END=631 /DNA_ORIENTATION=-